MTRRRSRGDYPVGYGRPPAQHRFKKGQASPNPKGRPRRSHSPDLQQVLLEPLTIKIGKKTERVPFTVAQVQILKEKALKGDLKASQMLLLLLREFKMLVPNNSLPGQPFTLKLGHPPDFDFDPPDTIFDPNLYRRRNDDDDEL